MRSKYLIGVLFLLLGIVFLNACENNLASDDFAESVELFAELEPVQQASDVTATITRGENLSVSSGTQVGTDSWFQIKLENIGANDIINNGTVGAWCLEWKKPLNANRDVHEGTKIYLTKGAEKWEPINYLFSIRNELKQEDPSLGPREFQAVIWSLAGQMGLAPEFNLTKLSDSELPQRLFVDGQLDLQKEKVLNIINRVQNEYKTNKSKTASFGGAVVMETHGDEQNVVIPDPPPTIEEDTNIYIYFDSSGSMSSTETPLNIMRNTLLKDALLPFYDNNETEYNNRVNVINYGSERTMNMFNILGQTEPAEGNVVVLIFQDEAQSIYHPDAYSFDPNQTRSTYYNSDIAVLRSRLNTFASTYGSNYYRGVIFQVDGFPGFKGFIQAVQNGTGNYAPPYGLSDRSEFNYVYDVEDGGTPTTYLNLVTQALTDLGFDLTP